MSTTTTVILYSTARLDDPDRVLTGAAILTGADCAVSAWRSIGPSREWDAMHCDDAMREADDSPTRLVPDYVQQQMVGRAIPVRHLALLMEPVSALSVHFGLTPLGSELVREYAELIPAKCRGECCPADPIITVGEHDVIEFLEDGGAHLIARATFSFRLFGYCTPARLDMFQKSIWRLPSLARLEHALRAMIGHIERCVIVTV